ncbi:hypothetical protein C7M84_016995 [Penaeus vannamei]|uniref:Uncharacterized protein n=1 Tax=Penaeus vannamei TaxID=6689 RepID=A0A423SLC7_PENVA|nr:hypothetical protein C7M84_016995 [Penaeus vannamei]
MYALWRCVCLAALYAYGRAGVWGVRIISSFSPLLLPFLSPLSFLSFPSLFLPSTLPLFSSLFHQFPKSSFALTPLPLSLFPHSFPLLSPPLLPSLLSSLPAIRLNTSRLPLHHSFPSLLSLSILLFLPSSLLRPSDFLQRLFPKLLLLPFPPPSLFLSSPFPLSSLFLLILRPPPFLPFSLLFATSLLNDFLPPPLFPFFYPPSLLLSLKPLFLPCNIPSPSSPPSLLYFLPPPSFLPSLPLSPPSLPVLHGGEGVQMVLQHPSRRRRQRDTKKRTTENQRNGRRRNKQDQIKRRERYQKKTDERGTTTKQGHKKENEREPETARGRRAAQELKEARRAVSASFRPSDKSVQVNQTPPRILALMLRPPFAFCDLP